MNTQSFRNIFAVVVVLLSASLRTAAALQAPPTAAAQSVAKQQRLGSGSSAALTEDGFQLVASLKSNDDMKLFMIRVLQAAGLSAWSTTAEEKLTNLITKLISEGQPVESFESLREVLEQEFKMELETVTTEGTQIEPALESKRESVAERDQHQVQKAFFFKAAKQQQKEDNMFTQRAVEAMKDQERRIVQEEERRVAELAREAAEKRAAEEDTWAKEENNDKATQRAFKLAAEYWLNDEAAIDAAEAKENEEAARRADEQARQQAVSAKEVADHQAEEEDHLRKDRYLKAHQAEWKAKQDFHVGDGESDLAKDEVWNEHLDIMKKLETTRMVKEQAKLDAEAFIAETERAVHEQLDHKVKETADRAAKEEELRKAKEEIERLDTERAAAEKEKGERKVQEEIAELAKEKADRRKDTKDKTAATTTDKTHKKKEGGKSKRKKTTTKKQPLTLLEEAYARSVTKTA